MLRIDRNQKHLVPLGTPTLAESAISERYDLQEYIFNCPDVFFGEIGQELFLLGKEVVASQDVQDRIDLLAVDREGACVIVELKRGNHKLHMLQAISYAGMISQWTSQELLDQLDIDRREALGDFLECDPEDINRSQRVILLAEAYDYALLIATQWLSESYGVDIACCRLAIAKDGASEYLVCTNVHPPPEIAEQATARSRKGGVKAAKWADWEAALAPVSNQAVVNYIRQQIEAGRENYLAKRILRYRLHGKRRWFLATRRKNAYVWQQGRFPGDIEYWGDQLGPQCEVKPVKDGECLRLFLHTEKDFQKFHECATSELNSMAWLEGGDDDAPSEDEAN